MSRLSALVSRIRRRQDPSPATSTDPSQAGEEEASLRKTLLRRRRIVSFFVRFGPHLRLALFVAGVVYTALLPYEALGRGHYISENALQPAQVNTYWNWADVHIADLFADDVAKWSKAGVSTEQRTKSIAGAFEKLGYATARQGYTYTLPGNSTLSGTNTYAILPAPKTDGAEAVVLGASWLSRAIDDDTGERRVNTRGVATVLALANYFKKYSMWSKDIIFLVSDGHSEGAQAWLDAYHDYGQSNLEAGRLPLTTGPIWAALNLDYPHHSFSHIGIFYEGADGHLPNLDLINSASRILRHVGIPTLLHTYDPSRAAQSRFFSSIPFSSNPVVAKYLHSAANLFRQVVVGAQGRIDGPEGAYGKYRIDAITWFGVPAEGPHGFHSIGQAVESTFRSLNNLLERFHQSFFLYIMTSVDSFIAVGNYLAAPILVGASLTVQGLISWTDATKNTRRARPCGKTLCVVAACLAVGVGELALILGVDPLVSSASERIQSAFEFYLSTMFLILHLVVPLVLAMVLPSRGETVLLSSTLRSTYLILSGLLVSITATLNFGLSVLVSLYLSILFALPFSKRYALNRLTLRRLQHVILACSAPTGIWGLARVVRKEQSEAWLRRVVLDWSVAGGGWSLVVLVAIVGPLELLLATSVVL
ncbi:hypothetical protein JCM10212_000993 [Sporobolomyces blumeae]